METYDTEGLITIQVAQLEKEKKEISERLRIVAKRIDHTERAYRREELPLLAEDYKNQQKTDRETFEAIQQARRELSRQSHQADLETKTRLTRLLGDYHARKEVMIAKKQEEFVTKKAAADRKIKEEKEKRLKSVLKAREEEKAKKEKEEQARLAEEAARLAEEERRISEEAAARAAADEEARKAEEAATARREARERERQEAVERARLQQQREEEAEARRQARAAEKAAEKAGLQRKPFITPSVVKAAVKEDSVWRRTPADATPIPAARPESPAPAAAKYKPPIAGGGWRARLEAKQAAGGDAPKEELKDDDGFQTVQPKATKELWRPRRGRG